jgi:hypothetical protein
MFVQVSNWGQRPLSQRQITYAALDAAVSIPLYNIMASQLPEDVVNGLRMPFDIAIDDVANKPSGGKVEGKAGQEGDEEGSQVVAAQEGGSLPKDSGPEGCVEDVMVGSQGESAEVGMSTADGSGPENSEKDAVEDVMDESEHGTAEITVLSHGGAVDGRVATGGTPPLGGPIDAMMECDDLSGGPIGRWRSTMGDQQVGLPGDLCPENGSFVRQARCGARPTASSWRGGARCHATLQSLALRGAALTQAGRCLVPRF